MELNGGLSGIWNPFDVVVFFFFFGQRIGSDDDASML